MKKVLIIGYVWPEPDSSAAGRHIMSILRAYTGQGWQVEFASPALPTEHMYDLSSEGVISRKITLNCDSFDAYVTDYQPDIVMFDRFMMEEQFGWRVEKHCPQAVRILDTEDLQCLRYARHQALKANREMTHEDLFSDLAKREIAAILRSDLTLIISGYEMDLLIDTFKLDVELLHHLPFMVALQAGSRETKGYEERKNFISIGNFRHAPNWDMVLTLRNIWPAIRNELPDAECHIYGAYPPPKATALHNEKTGFLIKGWAENALTTMEQYRLCLAPIRFGAGIKGKLLDAMIMQTPSVTTRLGSEGMHLSEPWPGEVVNDLADFSNAAVALYQNEAEWKQAQQDGNSLLHGRYDATVLAAELIDKILQVEEKLSQRRMNNFTGSMLRHHSMMSTKYMSQWIAEKNSNKHIKIDHD